MVDHQFEGGSILSQLQCSGMTSVLELMQQGFPSRTGFIDLYEMYRRFLPPELARLDPRLFCKALFRALGMNEKDYKFGVSKVFFRPGKFAEFDAIMRSDPDNLAKMVDKVKKWLLQSHWKKAQWCALSVIKLRNKILYRRSCHITIQKNIRMYLAKKKHRPRYRGIMKINSLQSMLSRMESIIGQLKKDKESSVSEVRALQNDMQTAINKIKANAKIKVEEINTLYTQLMNKANSLMGALQKKLESQKSAEEQERLRKIQQEMEKQKKQKEEEERQKREEEDNKKKKTEMEARRKQEEEVRKRQELEDKRAAEALQDQMEHEESQFREQLEQERRDHELALRLAQETNGQVEDLSPPTRRSGRQAEPVNSKYDLSKWKYSELRDTINTSCDIDLLEACRVEFHRRLKVYHAWKAKNRRRTTMDENERAPRSVMDAASKTPRIPTKSPITSNSQRFFRIPFIRPAALTNGSIDVMADNNNNKRGWWYAHFDGQYVARQMELHPDKPAILLVAGTDDMQMCELSLEETGLTRKRGAEILEHEFAREWERHGGKPYKRPSERIK